MEIADIFVINKTDKKGAMCLNWSVNLFLNYNLKN